MAGNISLMPSKKANAKSVSSADDRAAIKTVEKKIKNHFIYSEKVDNTALRGEGNAPAEEPLLYIFNYEGGGTCVVSGDSRFGTMLVQFDKNVTISENMEVPGPFIDYLHNASQSIKKIKEGRMAIRKNTNSTKLSATKSPTTKDINSECGGEFDLPFGSQSWSCFPGWEFFLNNEGPIVQTQWGQSGGYNDLIEESCGSDQAPVGCVATAMAQALSVIQVPTTYNWSSMSNYSSSYETARLMRDLGDAVDMDYDCDGSGANFDDANDAFHAMGINTFYVNYNITSSTPSFENYGTWIRNRLTSTPGYGSVPPGPARPIMAGGCRSISTVGWWIFKFGNSYGECHAFLIDGHRNRRYSDTTIMPGYEYRYAVHAEETFHFNFGWSGSFDGWYKINFADNSNYIDPSINFLWGQDMIVDISI